VGSRRGAEVWIGYGSLCTWTPFPFLVDAGSIHGRDGRDAKCQPGEGEDPQSPGPDRGWPQFASGVLCQLSSACQYRDAAAVDEFQADQIHDDLRLADRGRREPGRHERGVEHIKFPLSTTTT
jgi:hypothetical protein